MKVYIVELAEKGTRRVELPEGPFSIEFELDGGDIISVPLNDGGGLEVRCPEGRLVIKPDVSNQVTIEVSKSYGIVSRPDPKR
jgi:hypothetical protein